MTDINVENCEDKEAVWCFHVTLKNGDEIAYKVDVDKDYYKALTNHGIPPDVFVKRSFEFLLAREPKEAILRYFNVKEINNYFPEYEEEIRVAKEG